MSIVRGMLCFLCLGLLLVACRQEEVDPVSPTAGAVNPASPTMGKEVAAPLSKLAQRPISDFLSTQTFPTPWGSPKSVFLYIVDYAGWVDRDFELNLGTTFDGTVTEQPLSNGTAEINIDVRSHNAATWMFNRNTNERVFGMDPWSVQLGATPTLGDVHFKCTLIISAPGAPIPDILEAFGSVTRIAVEASAFGPLTAAAGMGPDGKPGHGWMNQVGLLTKINGKPRIDGFAAENVNLQRVGQ